MLDNGVMNYKRKHKGSRKKRLYSFLSSWSGAKHAKRFYESRLAFNKHKKPYSEVEYVVNRHAHDVEKQVQVLPSQQGVDN